MKLRREMKKIRRESKMCEENRSLVIFGENGANTY
jgi:hypothetical protein